MINKRLEHSFCPRRIGFFKESQPWLRVGLMYVSTVSGKFSKCLLRWSAWASGTLLGATLSGCAFAPGLTLGESLKQSSGQSDQYLITTRRKAASYDGVVAEQRAAAHGLQQGATLTAITTDLIQRQRLLQSREMAPEVKAMIGTAEPYRIAPLDILNILVWGRPEFSPSGAAVAAGATAAAGASPNSASSGFTVDYRGHVQLPLVGNIKLAGLTTSEARDVLQSALSRYFKHPDVTVRVQSYRGLRIYVSGEVANQGLQTIDDIPMTLAEVLGRAGGFTPLADPSAIAITRNGKTSLLNLNQLADAGLSATNVVLKSGDTVQVRSREAAKVFILGEVPRAGSQMLRNGRLTLNEALGDAGGINPGTGDPRQLYVIRHPDVNKTEIFHLDASTASSYALAEGFELQARDVVFVDPVPLVNWNRVISLILPSAQAVTVTRDSVGLAR